MSLAVVNVYLVHIFIQIQSVFHLFFLSVCTPLICIIITLLFNTIKFVYSIRYMYDCSDCKQLWKLTFVNLFKELYIPIFNATLNFVHNFYDSVCLPCIFFREIFPSLQQSIRLRFLLSLMRQICFTWTLKEYIHTLTLLYYNLSNILIW